MDLVFVRHGQSGNNLIWERTGASAGRSPDPELTELGRRQADAVAVGLADGRYGTPPTHLHTSLMLRAVQTAAPIGEALDLPLLGHREIFEVMGPVDHDGDEQAARPHPGAGRAELTAVSPRLVWPDGGGPDEAAGGGWWPGPVEAYDDVPARARRVARALVAAHGPDDVVGVVSHGAFGQFLLRELLGIERMAGWIELRNTSVTRFRHIDDPDRPTLAVTVNGLDHLRTAGVADST